MTALQALLRDKPPSKRWTLVYLAATVVGFLMSSYADTIADKLAPESKSLDIETLPAPMPRETDENPYDVLRSIQLREDVVYDAADLVPVPAAYTHNRCLMTDLGDGSRCGRPNGHEQSDSARAWVHLPGARFLEDYPTDLDKQLDDVEDETEA